MIDIHNHIIPNVDDGSKNIDESISMLNTAINQGISDVVSTVHFQHPKMDNKNNFEELNQKLIILQNTIGNKIKLHLAAEVFYLPNLVSIKSEKYTVFKNGKYMLIEFLPYFLPINYEVQLKQLIRSGTTPIIAHPERNIIFRKNITLIEQLIQMGCLMQINGGSLLGNFGRHCKDFSIKLLRYKMVHFLSSDAHNSRKRNFCLSDAFEFAFDIIGEQALILVKDNPKKVLLGEYIEPFFIEKNYKKKSFLSIFFK